MSQDLAIARVLGADAPQNNRQHYRKLLGFTPADPARLRHRLERSAASSKGLVVSVSHDHYLTEMGGLQNCVGLEQEAFAARGWSYLHLCPYLPLPTLADDQPGTMQQVVVTLDGETEGIIGLRDLSDMLALMPGQAERRMVIIHQMLGQSPEQLQHLVRSMGQPRAYFWIHDLFAHCSSIHLLRNDVVFCHGPPVGSSACAICNAGPERPSHVARMRAFFERLNPTLLAPSQTILDEWRRLNDFRHAEAMVLPPCRFEPGAPVTVSHEKLRVGFLGWAAFHKGWDCFASLALWFHDDPRYQFYQLADNPEVLPGVVYHPVKVTPDDRDAMVRAVAECELDVVINWSRCYESFSFTTMEALAGGAFLVAREGAGNVFPLVQSIDEARGIAVGSPTELQALFLSGDVIDLAREAPRRYGFIAMGAGAAELAG
ncbi:MAG: hypothetical protein RQ966_08910 [Acetobacteraceae bacterium]|nr:hypothetical protein [Acetobacteraceae bacterium]